MIFSSQYKSDNWPLKVGGRRRVNVAGPRGSCAFLGASLSPMARQALAASVLSMSRSTRSCGGVGPLRATQSAGVIRRQTRVLGRYELV